MHPYLFKIGDFPIRSFGVMVMLGVIAGMVWLGWAFRRLGVPGEDPLGDAVTRILIWGFVGARLMYLAVHPDAFTDWLSPIAVWRGGLVSYGGFLGGAFGAWMFARRVRLPLLRLGDAIVPGLALGQAFGRIGCLLVGDDYGRPWDGPWAITFRSLGVDPATGARILPEGTLFPPEWFDLPVHPTQLYLSAMNLALFAAGALLFRRRRFDGHVAAVLMSLYAIGRFAAESTRGDDAARGMWNLGSLELSTAQWISMAILACGMVIYARQRSRPSAAVAPSSP